MLIVELVVPRTRNNRNLDKYRLTATLHPTLSKMNNQESRPSGQEIEINLDQKAEQLKEKLADNVESAIAINDDLDDLSQTAEDISVGADAFEKNSKALERQEHIEFLKSRAIYIAVPFLVVSMVGMTST